MGVFMGWVGLENGLCTWRIDWWGWILHLISEVVIHWIINVHLPLGGVYVIIWVFMGWVGLVCIHLMVQLGLENGLKTWRIDLTHSFSPPHLRSGDSLKQLHLLFRYINLVLWSKVGHFNKPSIFIGLMKQWIQWLMMHYWLGWLRKWS